MGFALGLCLDRIRPLRTPAGPHGLGSFPISGFVGLAMLAWGAALYLHTASRLLRARRKGALLTDGLFACCRHPLYVIDTALLAPGVGLWLGSWAALVAPLAMALAATLATPREEASLREAFPRAYESYARRVPRWPRVFTRSRPR